VLGKQVWLWCGLIHLERKKTMTARASRTIGNRLQRYRSGLSALQSKAADFKHLAPDVTSFGTLLDQIESADQAQEKAKLALKKATEAVGALLQQADERFASLKRSWQAKYGPTSPEGKAFDGPSQGRITARKVKTPTPTPTPTP
jgi:hypothetical protein